MQRAEYYGLLATTLTPTELGSAAFRRLRRMTIRKLRALMPAAAASAPFDVTSALKLSCPEDFAERMRGVRSARGPIEPNERAEARHLFSKHFPQHVADVHSWAERVLGGELYLFGRWREHSRGELALGITAIDWRRDPLHGGRAPDVPSRTLNPDVPGFDARALWEAGRCAHVLWLAQAHVLQGLNRADSESTREQGLYARAAALHIRDFLATQPVGRGIHWSCPMEVALRAIHLSMALSLLRDAPELDSLFWTEAAVLLTQHGRFIANELEDAQTVPGNHLLTDLAGLAVIGCLFPELPDALEWRVWAVPAFAEELLRQTTPEGLGFEASIAYHRYATELGLLVQAIARRQGLSLGTEALTRLWRMCDVVEGATLADGCLANIGDNDSSRAFSAVIRGPLESAHVLALRAALGGPGVPGSIEPESLWIGGLSGLRQNVLRTSARLANHLHRSGRFSCNGLTVLRSTPLRSAALWAGDNGQRGLGGHAHNDKLSAEIVLNGRRIVVDPGCPTYFADPDERDRYRATSAHPTVQVDHQEQAPIPRGRMFLLPEAARAHVVRVDAHSAWAEHAGYVRVRPAVVHRREVALPPAVNAVCVTDWILGDGAHVIDLRWPFASRDVEIRRARSTEVAMLDCLMGLPCGEGRFDTSRVFTIRDGDSTTMLAIACEQPWEAELTESTWSPGYGERVCGRTAVIRVRAQCPVSMTSAFVAMQ